VRLRGNSIPWITSNIKELMRLSDTTKRKP
jgi:hypothetical protein